MEAPLPETRIGDRERREVDDRLQAALADGVLTLSEYDERSKECWAARIRSDLDALTRDLPEPHHPDAARPAPVVPAAAAPVRARPYRRLAGRLSVVLLVLAVISGLRVIGDDGTAVFTSRVVQVGSTQDRVQVGTLFGSTRVEVPDGVRVRTSGTLIFGGMHCDEACRVPEGAREIVVEGNGAFGSVDVVTSAEAAADAAEDAADAAEDAAQDAEDARDG